jgi:hypothetical protein
MTASARKTPSPFWRAPPQLAAEGPRHHQSRHRSAGLQNPGAYRRSGGQGAARRSSRLHAGKRHPAGARSGLPPHPDDDRRRGLAGQRDDHAGRQADHVRGDHHVRRAGRGNPLSRSRLPDLPLDDRAFGANPIPVPIREENGFAFSAEETLALITPKTRLLILNSPANPTGGVTPKGGDRQAGEGARGTRRWRSCRTRSTTS